MGGENTFIHILLIIIMDLALSGPFQSNENLNSHPYVLFFLAVCDEAKHIINAITIIFQPMKPNTVNSA